jgi:hypothetical protein
MEKIQNPNDLKSKKSSQKDGNAMIISRKLSIKSSNIQPRKLKNSKKGSKKLPQ